MESKNFVEQAVQKGHPRAFGSLLPEVLQDSVNKNLSMSSAEIAEVRAQWFKNGYSVPSLWRRKRPSLKEVLHLTFNISCSLKGYCC
jgi:hypothetical protein